MLPLLLRPGYGPEKIIPNDRFEKYATIRDQPQNMSFTVDQTRHHSIYSYIQMISVSL